MSWNYRICTHVFSYKKTFVNNEKLASIEDQRLFSIEEVYYDENGKPHSHTKGKNPLGNWEDLSDLIGTVDLIKLALSKPIIDLDNFPNEWKK
jgi:hypothetical protein